MFKQKPYRIALGVSLLIHLILFLLYKPLSGISGLIDLSSIDNPPEEPLTFELVDQSPKPQELVETPEDARTDKTPQDAQFLSDKNAQAQDMNSANIPNGLSFSRGVSDYKIFAGGQAGGPQAVQQEQPQQEDKQGEAEQGEAEKQRQGEKNPYTLGSEAIYSKAFSAMQKKKFDKKILQGAQAHSSQSPNSFSDDANWDQQQSSANALGGISLSTYQWDYAPYILYMKRRIRDHLYPPQAFVQLGAISGEVTLQFILRRDGTVRGLKVIGNEGHTAFIEPSLNSIKASDPFKPLPESFPDPYLELAWCFVYSVYR